MTLHYVTLHYITYVQAFIQTFIQTLIRTLIQKLIQTLMLTVQYIHTHTYIHICFISQIRINPSQHVCQIFAAVKKKHIFLPILKH